MKVKPETIDEYISGFPEDVQARMQEIRSIVKQYAPDAAEVISYGMPAYKLKGMLLYFAAFKNHIGFYALPSGNEAFREEISAYKTGKGSVQFPHDKPFPSELITQIVKFRVKQNLERIKLRKK